MADNGGILLCTPTREHAIARMAYRAALIVASNGADTILDIPSHHVTLARNLAVRRLLSSDAAYLLFIDDDVIPHEPEHVIDRLLECESDIACGCVPIMTERGVRLNIAAAGEKDWRKHWPDGIVQVERFGLGCALIHRRVFEALPHPWFRWRESADGVLVSEDVYFALLCAQKGFVAKAHGRVRCDHMKYQPLCVETKDGSFAAEADFGRGL